MPVGLKSDLHRSADLQCQNSVCRESGIEQRDQWDDALCSHTVFDGCCYRFWQLRAVIFAVILKKRMFSTRMAGGELFARNSNRNPNWLKNSSAAQ